MKRTARIEKLEDVIIGWEYRGEVPSALLFCINEENFGFENSEDTKWERVIRKNYYD